MVLGSGVFGLLCVSNVFLGWFGSLFLVGFYLVLVENGYAKQFMDFCRRPAKVHKLSGEDLWV